MRGYSGSHVSEAPALGDGGDRSGSGSGSGSGGGRGSGGGDPTGRFGRRGCAADGASATGTDTSEGSEASMAALEGAARSAGAGEEKSAAAEGGGKRNELKCPSCRRLAGFQGTHGLARKTVYTRVLAQNSRALEKHFSVCSVFRSLFRLVSQFRNRKRRLFFWF